MKRRNSEENSQNKRTCLSDNKTEEKTDIPENKTEDDEKKGIGGEMERVLEIQRNLHFALRRAYVFRLNALHVIMQMQNQVPFLNDRLVAPSQNPVNLLQVVLEPDDGQCPICLEDLKEATQLVVKSPHCDHPYHLHCVQDYFQNDRRCPVCRKPVSVISGYQPQHPDNFFVVDEDTTSLPGFESEGTKILRFFFASGIQSTEDPSPGEPYCGKLIEAFLPDNSEGNEVVRMLRIAYERRLLFRINDSGVLVDNGIELKTRKLGGPMNQGYPDVTYFCRLKTDLHELGVY